MIRKHASVLAFAFALVLALVAGAQERKVGLGSGGGISTVTQGTTPTSGCAAGGVFRSISALVDCQATLIESKGAVILDPSGARDVVVWRAPYACTASAVRGYTTGGTSADINARKNGTDALLAADLTATAGSWTSNTTLQNASFAAGDSLEVRLISLSGSPTAVAIQVECTR